MASTALPWSPCKGTGHPGLSGVQASPAMPQRGARPAAWAIPALCTGNTQGIIKKCAKAKSSANIANTDKTAYRNKYMWFVMIGWWNYSSNYSSWHYMAFNNFESIWQLWTSNCHEIQLRGAILTFFEPKRLWVLKIQGIQCGLLSPLECMIYPVCHSRLPQSWKVMTTSQSSFPLLER